MRVGAIRAVVNYTLVTHSISASAGANGSISPSGTVDVIEGNNQAFVISPSTGYIVSDVLVDSATQGRINSYTFSNVSAAHTISATFDGGWSQPSDTDNSFGVVNATSGYSSNNSYAVFDNSADQVDYDDFSIPTIPAGATINGIEVAIEGNRTSGRTLDVSLTWDEGSTWTAVKNLSALTSSDSTIILGGPSDLWGRTWNASEFTNSTFKIRTDATTGGGDINLDQIQVKVSYTPDTTAPTGGSISYTDGFYTSLSVPITYTTGTDGESGLNLSSGKIQRASAPLFGGTCGTFGSFADLVTESDGSYTDASVLSNTCYMYQYVIADNAANSSTYTSANIAKVDAIAPMPVMTSSASNPTNQNPIAVIVSFLEPVTGFDINDLVVVGGTAGNFMMASSSEYSFDITPDADPITITANIAASAAVDAAGNNSAAATQFSRTHNSTALSVTVNSGPTDGSIITVNNPSFTFTTDGDDALCSIDGGSSYSACTTFTAPSGTQDFNAPTLAEGDHTFVVKVSAAGMDDVVSAPRTFTVDTIAPSVSLTSPASPGPVAAPFSVTATFSEDVTGFESSDIVLGNATLSNFLQVTPMSYTFDVTPTANGPVTVDVPASSAQDVAGHNNTAAPQFSITYFFMTYSSNTVIVLSGDLDTETDRFVAAANNSGKWFFYNDENDTIDNSIGSFVSGPSTAPAGNGSVQMTVSGTQRRNLATYGFKDVKLADIKTLEFSTYSQSVGNGSPASERAAYLQFNVDFANNDTWQRRLSYVPANNGVVTNDVWQSWDAIDGGNAMWTYSGANWPAPLTGTGSTPKTWNEILAAFPNAETRSTDSFLGFRVGEPYADGFTGNVDNFVIGVLTGSNIHTTTYDFENKASTEITITNAAELSSTPSSKFSTYEVKWSVSVVAPGSGTPTGTVTVNGLTSGSSCSADVSIGTCSLNSPIVGTETLVASYSGDTNFNADDSDPVSHELIDDSTTSGGGGGGGNGPIFGGSGGSVLGASIGPSGSSIQGQVLGASTSTASTGSTSCTALISKIPLRRGIANDPAQVRALQMFLNTEVSAGLPITGFFGPLTESAVKTFQTKYMSHVLTPWGLTQPTGIVSVLSQWKINMINCPSLNLSQPSVI